MRHRWARLHAHVPSLLRANHPAEDSRVRASEQGTESQMASGSRKSIENGRPPCRHPQQILLSEGVKTSELVRRGKQQSAAGSQGKDIVPGNQSLMQDEEQKRQAFFIWPEISSFCSQKSSWRDKISSGRKGTHAQPAEAEEFLRQKKCSLG